MVFWVWLLTVYSKVQPCAAAPWRPLSVHRHDGPNVGRVVAGDALNGVLRSMLWGHALPHALHSLRVRSQSQLARQHCSCSIRNVYEMKVVCSARKRAHARLLLGIYTLCKPLQCHSMLPNVSHGQYMRTP